MKIFLRLVVIVISAALGMITYLTATEYKPEPVEKAEIVTHVNASEPTIDAADSITLTSWNIGYAGLGENAEFVMDGGSGNGTPSEGDFAIYYQGVKDTLAAYASDTDIFLLQEVDKRSTRSKYTNESEELPLAAQTASSAFALNYKCTFVPYPLPPISTVESGIQTTSVYGTESAQRISLTCPFGWPVSTANLKRCLLVSRYDVEGTDKQLVVVNLHLEAYDDGEGRAKQTKELMKVLEDEYAKGNYVIAGGDFNQSFPEALEAYPVKNSELWTPGTLEEGMLPEGWSFAYDASTPTCRLLNGPYDANSTQHYVIDGFIASPNVKVESVATQDEGFKFSDHNPVTMQVKLK